MNKKLLVLMIVLLVAVSFIGCTQNKNETNGKEVSAKTIKEILEKGKSVQNIEYDVSVILNDTPLPVEMKVYQKGEKYRMDAVVMGQKTFILFDGTYLYTYDANQDIYYQQEAPETGNQAIDFKDIAEQALKDVSMKELGTENINGLNTRIIEFSYKETESDTAQKTKAWISEEYGIPVKLETTATIQGTTTKSTLELKNIKVNSVQDSVFVVPQEKVKSIEDLINDYVPDYNAEDFNY